MQEHSRQEIEAAHGRYVETRNRIEAGELGWNALADFFTDDATFIDPAWGRLNGKDRIRKFFVESMAGLEGWSFPHQWRCIDGNRVVAAWKNRLPGRREDGSHYEAQGISILLYAGGGLFSYEEDLLNMVHVFELIEESGWTPGPEVNMPPQRPPR
jgi:ketosteroid isomerase-like protein